MYYFNFSTFLMSSIVTIKILWSYFFVNDIKGTAYINKAYTSSFTIYQDLYFLSFSKYLNFTKYIKEVILYISAKRA